MKYESVLMIVRSLLCTGTPDTGGLISSAILNLSKSAQTYSHEIRDSGRFVSIQINAICLNPSQIGETTICQTRRSKNLEQGENSDDIVFLKFVSTNFEDYGLKQIQLINQFRKQK